MPFSLKHSQSVRVPSRRNTVYLSNPAGKKFSVVVPSGVGSGGGNHLRNLQTTVVPINNHVLNRRRPSSSAAVVLRRKPSSPAALLVSVVDNRTEKPSCILVPNDYLTPIDERGGVKWLGDDGELPINGGGPDGGGGLDDGVDGADDGEPKTIKEKIQKGLKILLPHVGLTTLLLSYIAGGAAIFQWLETDREMMERRLKVTKIHDIYEEIINASFELCSTDTSMNEIKSTLMKRLHNLSMTHEFDNKFHRDEQLWNPNTTDIDTRWTFQAAVLYALTVITTTGYDHITPLTKSGRLFTVFFGLFGIPLMFITAADIGKFLSECVTTMYAKFLALTDYIRDHLFQPCWRCFSRCCRRSSEGGGNNTPNGDVNRQKANKKDPLSESVDPLAAVLGIEEVTVGGGRVQLPIVAYFCLILGYCAVGGLMFTQFESGDIWTFIHGFFFSFNTITTIGLGNIRVENVIYLVLIVCYVIVGLAVITMCVDLASSQLKVFFTKLHYFGRRFRGARAFMNMSDDIKEAMKIIHALKRTRGDSKGGPGGDPGGPGITLEDIKQFLEIEQQYQAQPFVPRNINFLRWVDDEEMTASMSARSGSLCLKHVSSDPTLHI